jgi:hypothetical protein
MRTFRQIFFVQLLFFGAALVLCASGAVAAQEEILNFESQISVHGDSTVTVIETITVQSAGQEIKRGIYRDFPTAYTNRQGNTVRAGFKVLGVTREGQTIDFWVEKRSDGPRVYMGNKDKFIKPGVHTFQLTYKTDRQIGYFKDFDEIYWNVTGDRWAFPIRQAEAVVHLPAGAKVVQSAAYTGRRGSKGQAYSATTDLDGSLRFSTTNRLNRGEGLTIAVAWPKGFVVEPKGAQKATQVLEENLSIIAALVGLLLVLAYYLFAWNRVGRDLVGGPIVPLFEAPKGFSPAASRYLSNMRFDNTVFAAAVVSMAVKGALKIEDDNGTFYVTRTSSDTANLSPGEKALSRVLFSGAQSVELDNENHGKIGGARGALEKKLKRELETIHFNTNRLYLLPGIVLSVITVLFIAGLSSDHELVLFMALWVSGWTAGCYGLIVRSINTWKAVTNGGKGVITAIVNTLFAAPFLIGEVAGLIFLADAVSLPTACLMVLIAAFVPFFHNLLRAPTLKGRRVMDQINGFKLYLSVAEKHRLEALHPPKETPELFEAYLPYALALDVGHEWSTRFAGLLSGAGNDPGRGYQPGWYSGSSWNSHGLSGLGDNLSNSFSDALGSSATAPSSSGSGGGGFSGGGGGGGGGGGF